jgi:serine/threonine protein kinase
MQRQRDRRATRLGRRFKPIDFQGDSQWSIPPRPIGGFRRLAEHGQTQRMAPGRSIAGYRILMDIGRGAASELYAVQDAKTKQVWALKHVIKSSEKDQRFIEQVMTEYSVGSRMTHPNIRAVHRLIRRRKWFKVTMSAS